MKIYRQKSQTQSARIVARKVHGIPCGSEAGAGWTDVLVMLRRLGTTLYSALYGPITLPGCKNLFPTPRLKFLFLNNEPNNE